MIDEITHCAWCDVSICWDEEFSLWVSNIGYDCPVTNKTHNPYYFLDSGISAISHLEYSGIKSTKIPKKRKHDVESLAPVEDLTQWQE